MQHCRRNGSCTCFQIPVWICFASSVARMLVSVWEFAMVPCFKRTLRACSLMPHLAVVLLVRYHRQHVSCCSSGEQAPMPWLHLCARLPALTCLPPQRIFTVCLATLEQLWSAPLSGPLQWDLSSRLGEVSSPAEVVPSLNTPPQL